jgi:hypothetical protein
MARGRAAVAGEGMSEGMLLIKNWWLSCSAKSAQDII